MDIYSQWASRFELACTTSAYPRENMVDPYNGVALYCAEGLSDWTLELHKPWDIYVPTGFDMPDQGWKIHTSSVPDEAHRHLEIVTEVVRAENVAFKHLHSDVDLRRLNGKYADRGSSGKFTTIYPKTEGQFIRLLRLLDDKLSDLNGPYILSDLKYASAPVYFRYGAFKLMTADTGDGVERLVLFDSNGNPYEDRRDAFFHLPAFVDIPVALRHIVHDRLNPDRGKLAKDFQPYKIHKALHYSNSGGVYLAECGSSSVTVKESREFTAPSTDGSFASDRLFREYQNLERLREVRGVINPRELRTIEGNLYLFEDYFDGVTAQSWIAANFPFFPEPDSLDSYEHRVRLIITSLVDLVDQVHSAGVAIVDLQLKNILIDEHGSVRLIDLEFSSDLLAKSPAPPTPGFSPNRECAAYIRDKFALFVCALSFFSPPFTTFVTPSTVRPRIAAAKSVFSKESIMLISSLLEGVPWDCFESAKGTTSVTVPRDISACEQWLKPLVVDAVVDSIDDFFGGDSFPGDLDSLISPGTKINVLNGISGIALMLKRSGAKFDLDRYVSYIADNVKEIPYFDGLLCGRVGVYAVLCELGYSSEALRLLADDSSFLACPSTLDMSLASGIAGTLCSLDQIYRVTGATQVREQFSRCVSNLSAGVRSRGSRVSSRYRVVGEDVGLWTGWSGVSVAYSICRTTPGADSEFCDLALLAFGREIEHFRTDEDKRYFVAVDEILYPYLGIGSAGSAFAAYLLPDSDLNRNYFEGLVNACISPFPPIYGGLTNGYSGLVAVLAGCGGDLAIPGDLFQERLSQIAQIFCSGFRDRKGINILSEGGYYLSSDYSTGGAGLLGALLSVETRKNSWFPLMQGSWDGMDVSIL